MQEARKQTSWKEFIKEICSWYWLVFRNTWKGVTTYPKNKRVNIFDINEYEENRINFTKFWLDYFSNKSFFSQIEGVRDRVWLPAPYFSWEVENSNFSDGIRNAKNTYLSFQSWWDIENILYSFYVKINCKDVLNSIMVRDNSNIIYHSSWIINSYKIYYSKYIQDSSNIRFSDNMVWCQECVFL